MLTEINGYKAHVCDRCRKIVYQSRTAKKRSKEVLNVKMRRYRRVTREFRIYSSACKGGKSLSDLLKPQQKLRL